MRLNGDRRIVFYSICSKCPPFACTHAVRRLHHLSVALSVMLWSTSCHTCSTHCFSSSVSCTRDWYTRCWTTLKILPVINRIKVRAVRWPKLRWNERRRSLLKKSQCHMPGMLEHCDVQRRKMPLIPCASQVVAALTGLCRGSMRR